MSKSNKPVRSVICTFPAVLADVYGPEGVEAIARRTELLAPPTDSKTLATRKDLLANVDVIFGSWGMLTLDEVVLAAAPCLQYVFYAAGSVKGFTTDQSWDRGIGVSSTSPLNAVPVAEYTLSQILFGLKSGWQHVIGLKRDRLWKKQDVIPGAFRTTVGLVSLGAIGRIVAEHLKRFDVRVIAYDPFATAEQADALGVQLVQLAEVFRDAQVVSIHTPWLPETEGLITGDLLRSMRPKATLINTARGAVVDEPALCDVLAERCDLVAVLDVTHPEPPADDSPLWSLPNAILTPHIAGALTMERRRMGEAMIDEFDRWVSGQPLRYAIDPSQIAQSA